MTSSADTVVAIATPLGIGGLGVIRLSGALAIPITERILSRNSKTSLLEAPSHTLHHGFIKSDQQTIDEVVVGLFRNPHSYTGEDVIEISCHGSPLILKEVVEICQQQGARLARPGEFTERAFLNGKLDLAQAEAVVDLIHAQTHKARLEATQQLQGTLSQRIRDLRQRLLRVLAELEANLDFVEEDIPPLERTHLQKELVQFENNIRQLLATSVRARLYRRGIRIALVGCPNVGKSSLFNALLAFDRAIVSDQPGTTRDTIEEQLEWNGLPVVLIDTAGVRQTKDSIEEKGMTRTRQVQQLADIVFFLIDGSQALTLDDKTIADTLNPEQTVVILNKSDRAKKISVDDLRQWKFETAIPISALQATGLDDLKKVVIEKYLTTDKVHTDTSETPTLMNARHVENLEKALAHIQKALVSLEKERSEESISVDVRSALEDLSGITGEAVSEDLLSQIFSTFCIGK